MLNSLQVTNFRAFKDLRVDRLGRVNLIVGRNNVGKTTFLEAIHIYSSSDTLAAAMRLLSRRQEYSIDKGGDLISLNSLFCRNIEESTSIEIGKINDSDKLSLRTMWRWIEDAPTAKRRYSDEPEEAVDATEVLMVERGDETQQSAPIHSKRSFNSIRRRKYDDARDNSLFLHSGGFYEDDIDPAELWDRVVIADNEHSVISTLKLIEPELERVVMVQGKRPGRLAMSKLAHQKTIPLRSLGDGMNRLFELALGLVNVKEGGVFLVDEIDSGLHFTTLVDVWRLVFNASASLNVQVFATTHRWECIEAFQQVATEHPEEGVLIRLERGTDGIRAETFSEEELAIITRESIEVR